MGNEAERIYRETLMNGAQSLGLDCDSSLCEQMAAHYSLLCRWAQRMNLTSVTDPEEAARLHGLDCLLFADFFEVTDEEIVADIGSGAGFPGIILALARPRLKMTLVEPLRKRTSFLKVALSTLERPDVQVLQSKIMPCSRSDWQCSTMVSRATIAPVKLLKLAPPYLLPGGRLITTSGDGASSASELQKVSMEAGFVSLARKEWELPGGQTRILDEFTLAG